jgi:hypothetical protein
MWRSFTILSARSSARPAKLTPTRPGAAGAAVTVIERTTAANTSEEVGSDTLRPAHSCDGASSTRRASRPRSSTGGTIVLGGRSWRIEAHAPRPGLDGEASGEILMRLVEEADG